MVDRSEYKRRQAARDRITQGLRPRPAADHQPLPGLIGALGVAAPTGTSRARTGNSWTSTSSRRCTWRSTAVMPAAPCLTSMRMSWSTRPSESTAGSVTAADRDRHSHQRADLALVVADLGVPDPGRPAAMAAACHGADRAAGDRAQEARPVRLPHADHPVGGDDEKRRSRAEALGNHPRRRRRGRSRTAGACRGTRDPGARATSALLSRYSIPTVRPRPSPSSAGVGSIGSSATPAA